MYARTNTGYVHRDLAEAALGRPLPPKAEVHHVDGDRRNNAPGNLGYSKFGWRRRMHQQTRRSVAAGKASRVNF